MKKIKIIGVGGTIASFHTDKGFKPGLSLQHILSYIPRVRDYYDIELEQIMNIDSANMQPEHWYEIAQAINLALNDQTVNGIVITHGTDTMTYTATAIAFLLPNINKPVVFTGAQISAEIFSSDAQRNMIDAIRVAGETDIAESVIVFNSRVYRGTRTIKLREYDLSAFETVDSFPIAEISRTINIIDPFAKTRHNEGSIIEGAFDPNVALIKIAPGLKPELLEVLPSMGYHGVVIEGYGAGNLPIEERSLIDSIKKLVSQNIPVIIASVCIYGKIEPLYETGILFIDAGAISAYDMISEVAMIKLMMILNKTRDMDEIRIMMKMDIAKEMNIG